MTAVASLTHVDHRLCTQLQRSTLKISHALIVLSVSLAYKVLSFCQKTIYKQSFCYSLTHSQPYNEMVNPVVVTTLLLFTLLLTKNI